MAGIYIHIPFCKQACSYCDFHFTTSLKYKEEMILSLCLEIAQKAPWLEGQSIDTIYFGGGTPSLLSIAEIIQIFDTVDSHYDLYNVSEITLEANPDDLSLNYIKDLVNHSPINRLSIGIQSFHDQDLALMNRAHNAREALTCLEWVKKAGLTQFSVDLIFALPWRENSDYWHHNLETIADFDVPHISCYQLTIEPRTQLHHLCAKGSLQETPDTRTIEEFYMTKTFLENLGYEHYEISNYALPRQYAVHNTSYWQGKPYLGIGPSAHSFLGERRFVNIANNGRYIKDIMAGLPSWEEEILETSNRWNEYILTSLRTQWGINEKALQSLAPDHMSTYQIQKELLIARGALENLNHDFVRITRDHLIMADAIALELFIDV